MEKLRHKRERYLPKIASSLSLSPAALLFYPVHPTIPLILANASHSSGWTPAVYDILIDLQWGIMVSPLA